MGVPGNHEAMVLAAAEAIPRPAASREELDVGAIYAAHAPFIGRVIQRLVGNGAHVDDLLQETFIVAHRRRADFDGSSEVTTWLYGIAANLCSRHRRGLSRFIRLKARYGDRSPDEIAPPIELADHTLEREHDVQLVRDAIQKLPFKQREVFVLHELEGLEGQQIAEMLDVPLGTVWTRLKKARETFMKLVRRRRLAEGGE
jgi:RNA polymerase sigma-70 factor (ECF subfamily)